MRTEKELNDMRFTAMRILAIGFANERPDTRYTNRPNLPPCDNPILSMIFHKKLPAFGVIEPPEWLIYMIELCSEGNPGYAQMLYKNLLGFINGSKFDNSGIPKDYTITTSDFSNCFAIEYPLCALKQFDDMYSKMWKAQKRKRTHPLESDNGCDYPEYWNVIMKIQ